MNILTKLYTGSPQQAIQDITSHREKNGYCVIDFLYFANIIKNNLLDVTSSGTRSIGETKPNNSYTAPHYVSSKGQGYYDSILAADFLLPDGIALQTFYASAVVLGRIQSTRKWLANCNGTDFTLPLLQSLQKQYPGIVLHMYGSTPTIVDKARVSLHDNGFICGVVQDGYSQRDRNDIALFSGEKQVLLVARGTPLQELWIQENISFVKDNNILVLSVGGLFDFWSGEEKRTPKIFRGRAEWLWRLFVNPRKNAIKVRYSLYLPYAIIRYLLLKR